MTITPTHPYHAPGSYEELFVIYRDRMRKWVIRLGVHDEHADDAVSDIMLSLFARDHLAKYDPEHRTAHGDQLVRTRFTSWLYSNVEKYCRGFRDKARKRREREVLWHQEPGDEYLPRARAGGHHVTEPGYHETVAPPDDDVLDRVDFEIYGHGNATYTAAQPRRSSSDLLDPLAVFYALKQPILTTGERDIGALRDHFGVSTTAMHTFMWWLRGLVADYYGDTLPAKRPRVLKPKA